MSSLLKSVSGFLDTVIRRGAPAAQQAAPAAARAAAPAARPEIPGLPPRPQKIRAPTADGRAPASPDDIDPALLKELYKVGPALKKQEVAKPTAPATGEDARRRRRFNELRRDEAAPAGRIAEADVANFLDWRAAGMAQAKPDVAGLARALACDDGTAAALLRTYGVPQIRQAGDLKVGLWAPGDALDLDGEEVSSASVDDEPLPGRRRRKK
jgi:hypothetical protein